MYEIIMELPFNGFHVKGILSLPVKAKSIIIFSHGIGSAYLSPHETDIASYLQDAKFGTLIFDFLDEHEKVPKDYRDISLLSNGLLTATNWLHNHSEYRSLDLGFLGSGTGAAIALKAATGLGSVIKAAISISGRLDLIQKELSGLSIPVLLIAGEYDFKGVNISKGAISHLQTPKKLAVIPAASHLFEEPGKTQQVAQIGLSWFQKYLSTDTKPEVLHQHK